MNWVKTIEDAIEYIEENITEDLTVSRIAEEVNTSAFYFQRGFSMLCGYTVGEYVRMRRLSIAGEELLSSTFKLPRGSTKIIRILQNHHLRRRTTRDTPKPVINTYTVEKALTVKP